MWHYFDFLKGKTKMAYNKCKLVGFFVRACVHVWASECVFVVVISILYHSSLSLLCSFLFTSLKMERTNKCPAIISFSYKFVSVIVSAKKYCTGSIGGASINVRYRLSMYVGYCCCYSFTVLEIHLFKSKQISTLEKVSPPYHCSSSSIL